MPTDLDTLMAHVHEINSKSAAEVTDHDIAVLIAYHRHNRARRAAGYKPAKLDVPKVDVLSMLGIKSTPKTVAAGTIRRR